MPLEEVFGHALRGETCYLTTAHRPPLPLPVSTWTRTADTSDELLLSLCAGPTIDVGCGPGRLTVELAARGHVALGIDVVPEAVGQSRRRGAAALRRDVFAPVPGEGRWETALLADGNIGIGGDPVALLNRLRRLLAPGGRLVVEAAAPHRDSSVFSARLECECGPSEAFRWAVVTVDELAALAHEAGLVEASRWTAHGRWATVLTEPA